MIYLITILLFAIYAGLILYYRQSWLSIPLMENLQQAIYSGKPKYKFHRKTAEAEHHLTSISVIIPARNEEKNIRTCLNSILAQSYPKKLFEIIVIDDFSTDDTAAEVNSFSNENISLISLKDFVDNGKIHAYKKKAIEIAVFKAKGDLIVTTDADCIVPPEWLMTISLFYEKNNPVFIAAPVVYSSPSLDEDGLGAQFLKVFQSLDFMTLQGITGAAVNKKFHCMCNGANLAYERKVFFEVNGFEGIDSIASGDDMLLMHKIFKLYPEKVLFLKSIDAVVQTRPEETLSAFFNQRIRWASKADKYTDKKIIVVLLVVYLLNVWILTLGILACLYPTALYWFTGLLITKIIIELFFLYPVAKFFQKQKLLWWFPFAQPFHILYTIIAGWLGKFGSYKWKERKVK